MSLVVRCSRICSPNPLVSYSAGVVRETAAGVSLRSHRLVLVLVLVPALTSVALAKLRHEVAVEHSLPHLRCLLSLSKLISIILVEPSDSSLVEYLLLVELVDIW